MPATSSTSSFPGINIIVLIAAVGLLRGRGRRRCSGCRRCASRASISRSRRSPRSSSCRGASSASRGSTITMSPARSRCRPARCSACRSPARTRRPMARYLVVLGIVVVMTWLASNLVHGRIGRMWMAVRDMDIAAELIGIKLYQTKLLAFAVSSFYCGVAGAHDGVPLARRRRGRQLQHQPVVPDPVHGDHRRARQPDRLVLRRGLHLGPADRAARAAGVSRARHQRRDRRAPAVHGRRRADHLLPDRRAARPRAAVADRESRNSGCGRFRTDGAHSGQFPPRADVARRGG